MPKNKDYKIADEDLSIYKTIIENVPEDKRLSIGIMTNNFIKSLVTKKNPIENIKADMKLKRLKGKEYIHSIGKWNEYLNFLQKNIQQGEKNNEQNRTI